jgi:hypothetical protein
MSRGRRLRRRLHNLRARSPHAPHLSASTLGHRRARTSSAIACLRQRITPHPGRLRSAQCSALRHSRESFGLLRYSRLARRSQHPFKRRGYAPLCRGMSSRIALPCVFLVCLAAHLDDAGKMPLTDFCNRPFATSTRRPFNSRAHSSRCSDHLHAARSGG